MQTQKATPSIPQPKIIRNSFPTVTDIFLALHEERERAYKKGKKEGKV